MTGFRNRYFFCDLDGTFQEFDRIVEDDQNLRARYFFRALFSIETATDLSGFVFAVMSQGTERLPVYGPNVVAIITSDDHYRVPAFAERVGMIFRTLGTMPFFEGLPSDMLRLLLLLRCLRSCALHGASRLRQLRRGSARVAPTRIIPLGDRDLVNLQPKPINERPYDTSFIGSVQMRRTGPVTMQALLGTPKAFSRAEMLHELEQYQASRPDSRVLLETTADFKASQSAGPERFSEVLADSRICIAPRGSCPETYRLFQGARFGCVLVAERQPPHWFYKDCPAYFIDRWSEFPALLDTLRADPALMARKSAESRRWWDTTVCEAVIGRYIADEVSRTLAGRGMAMAA